MVEIRDLVILFLTVCLVLFGASHRRELRSIPHASWFVGSVLLMLAAWVLHVAALGWPALSIAEHALYFASSLVLLIWSWNLSRATGRG